MRLTPDPPQRPTTRQAAAFRQVRAPTGAVRHLRGAAFARIGLFCGPFPPPVPVRPGVHGAARPAASGPAFLACGHYSWPCSRAQIMPHAGSRISRDISRPLPLEAPGEPLYARALRQIHSWGARLLGAPLSAICRRSLPCCDAAPALGRAVRRSVARQSRGPPRDRPETILTRAGPGHGARPGAVPGRPGGALRRDHEGRTRGAPDAYARGRRAPRRRADGPQIQRGRGRSYRNAVLPDSPSRGGSKIMKRLACTTSQISLNKPAR